MAKPQQPHNPDLLSRLVSDLILVIRLMFDRRVSTTAKLIPLIVLLYVISPVDLIQGKKRAAPEPTVIERDHKVTIIDGEYSVREDEQRDTHQVRR